MSASASSSVQKVSRQRGELPPYPSFAKGAGKKGVVAETPKEFQQRLNAMAAYLKRLVNLLGQFRKPGDSFPVDGVMFTRENVKNLLTQLGKDIKALGAYYKAQGKKTPRAGIQGGYRRLVIMTPKMWQFLKDADFGPLLDSDGNPIDNVQVSDALQFLGNNELRGVTSRGVIQTLFAIYAKRHNLVGRAAVNQDLPADRWNANWLGADAALKETFAEEIDAAIAESQERIAQGEREGQPMIRRRSGKRAAKITDPSKVRDARLFYGFDPDNFRWNDISSVFVSPNVTATPQSPEFLQLNQFAPSYFNDRLPEEQRDQLTSYGEMVAEAKRLGEEVPYRQFASQAAGVPEDQLLDVNPALYVRALTDEIQQTVSISNDGLKKTRSYKTPM